MSAGSTGALLGAATLLIKRIRGIRRAALAPVVPTGNGGAVLIDAGANVKCPPEYLIQFAYMGSYYAEHVLGRPQPKVGLLNIGAVSYTHRDVYKRQPQEYWSIQADLGRGRPNLGGFQAMFHGREKKMELHSEAEADAVIQAVSGQPFTVSKVKRQDKLRNPAPPFTTSTLQQEASRKLNMTPARTMSIAQQL